MKFVGEFTTPGQGLDRSSGSGGDRVDGWSGIGSIEGVGLSVIVVRSRSL